MSNRRKLKPAPRKPSALSDAERWDKACEYFPDPLENKVIALAEENQVMWERIPGYGLRFWYRSPEHMARFAARMAEIGQVLDDS